MLLSPPREQTDVKAKLFRGLADPTRLSILESLRSGPRCVGDIAGATGLTQSNVSNHLACLKDCGLATSKRQGRYVHYQLSDPRVAELLESVDKLLTDVVQGMYACTRYQRDEGATRD